MPDFFKIGMRSKSNGSVEIFPDFQILSSKDLLFKGGKFYAIWDEETGLWSKDELKVAEIVDRALFRYLEDNKDHLMFPSVKYMKDYSSNSWKSYKDFVSKMGDSKVQLDNKIIFTNEETKKTDYASKKLPYALEEGDISAYEELVSTLYSDSERAKFEWAIGSIIQGDSKSIQKFLVFYGEGGTGKSTILNIIQMLFQGYYTIFEGSELTSRSNAFSTEAFKGNPLVALEHDGDLSRIETNTRLNSIISHEEIIINEKYHAPYPSKMNALLFMATNKPVRITDSKSGIIRRLIDIYPTGEKLPVSRYNACMQQIQFELGAIANHCLQVFRHMGKNYYNNYRPVDMMYRTDIFFNFVEDNYLIFKEEDQVALSQAYLMYKEFCSESNIANPVPRYIFKEELKDYFNEFIERANIEDENGNRTTIRSLYKGFKTEKFTNPIDIHEVETFESFINFDAKTSLFDSLMAGCPAQYATEKETPSMKWADCETVLADINTKELHYVKLPSNHIVIDFDIPDETGEKSFAKNLEAASKWPPTYAELSKSGKGIHLHYIYNGNIRELSNKYDEHIEVKVFNGNASLRRKLTGCNDIPIATISSGLPLKGEKEMVNFDGIKSEKALRTLIENNLRKKYHPGTKPSIDFINDALNNAYKSGMHYDITDMRPDVLAFALGSTNHSSYCVKLVNSMKFKSEEPSENSNLYSPEFGDKYVFFDVEVFPNLFVVCWKYEGSDTVVRMINPKSSDVEFLFNYKLIGFNNRRYDNHILYAAALGYNNTELFSLSQRIINGSKNAFFSEAYNLSFTDIYDFSSLKQSLKKFEIDLGIHHMENSYAWDQDVPEDKWNEIADYCCNDVNATEATFKARIDDFTARQILADIAGLTENDTTQTLAARIIFGTDKHPQDKFIYTNLADYFEGYVFDNGKSTYRGEEVGEGGYVYAEPGIYSEVDLLDIASMHPSSLIAMNMFGPYTENFEQLKTARLLIKHKNFEEAGKMFNGKLAKHLKDASSGKKLAYALKIIINSVYGFTSASFDNKFKDPRNVDNIVAKRGALFMIDLKHFVQEKGFRVAHIKTDSIKIPGATEELIGEIMEYGRKWGYEFEHEARYERMALLNKAVYIAYEEMGEDAGKWVAVGDQFKKESNPYVHKTLLSHEDIELKDMAEVFQVKKGEIVIDMDEDLPEGEHNYIYVGRIGQFTPIKKGCGGGILYRRQDNKYYAVNGTKGYRWLETEQVKIMHREDDIDKSYYDKLVTEGIKSIAELTGEENEEMALKYVDQFLNDPELQFQPLPFPPLVESGTDNEGKLKYDIG